MGSVVKNGGKLKKGVGVGWSPHVSSGSASVKLSSVEQSQKEGELRERQRVRLIDRLRDKQRERKRKKRERGRQVDRQTNKPTDKQTDRQRDRDTHKQRDRQTRCELERQRNDTMIEIKRETLTQQIKYITFFMQWQHQLMSFHQSTTRLFLDNRQTMKKKIN